MLETFGDFFVPLMKVLDGLPNWAGKSGDVLRLFEQTYRDQIVSYQYTKNQSGRIRWKHNVRWSREKLKLLGFIDAPKTGIWRLTEKGHQWLVEHPKATHISVEESKSKHKNSMASLPSSQTGATPQSVLDALGESLGKLMPLFPVDREEFFPILQERIADTLKSSIGTVSYKFVQRSNYLQVRIDGFPGSHYEIILRQDRHEIALHFESSPRVSEARLFVFVPHVEELSQTLGIQLKAGMFGNSGWTQIWFDGPRQPLNRKLAQELSDQISRFIIATYPILQQAYSSQRRVRKPSAEKEQPRMGDPVHAVLDREIETIHAYLQGRSNVIVQDEKLCDWVNFCYTFELYVECIELFSLVSPDVVHPWYYERTKKIARLCALRAKNQRL